MSEERNYWGDIEDYAREIISENGLDEDAWDDAIHDTVDGSSWIIYYSKNETVLEETRNEPDNEDVAEMCNSKGGWKEMRQTAAHIAMERDLNEKLQEIKDEYFVCDDCEKTKKIEHQVEGEELCDACALVCPLCDNAFRKEDNEGDEEHPICPNCFDEEKEQR